MAVIIPTLSNYTRSPSPSQNINKAAANLAERNSGHDSIANPLAYPNDWNDYPKQLFTTIGLRRFL